MATTYKSIGITVDAHSKVKEYATLHNKTLRNSASEMIGAYKAPKKITWDTSNLTDKVFVHLIKKVETNPDRWITAKLLAWDVPNTGEIEAVVDVDYDAVEIGTFGVGKSKIIEK